MKTVQKLENEIFNREFDFKGSDVADNYFEKLRFVVNFRLPKTLGEMLNEKKVYNIRYKPVVNKDLKTSNYTILSLKDRKDIFFDNFYNYLEKIFDAEYLKNSPKDILSKYLEWRDTGKAKKKREKRAKKLMSKKDFEAIEKSGIEMTKFDVFSKIKNGRVFFSDDGKLELEAYSKKGLLDIFKKVNQDLLNDVETIHLQGRKYIKGNDRFFEALGQNIALFHSEKNKNTLVAYGYFEGDVFARQDVYGSKAELERSIGEKYTNLPLVKNEN